MISCCVNCYTILGYVFDRNSLVTLGNSCFGINIPAAFSYSFSCKIKPNNYVDVIVRRFLKELFNNNFNLDHSK